MHIIYDGIGMYCPYSQFYFITSKICMTFLNNTIYICFGLGL